MVWLLVEADLLRIKAPRNEARIIRLTLEGRALADVLLSFSTEGQVSLAVGVLQVMRRFELKSGADREPQ